jgi:hypothetical protein
LHPVSLFGVFGAYAILFPARPTIAKQNWGPSCRNLRDFYKSQIGDFVILHNATTLYIIPATHELMTIVRQFAPGHRICHSICVEGATATGAAEYDEVVRAMWDCAVVYPGVPVSIRQIDDLAQQYVTASRA